MWVSVLQNRKAARLEDLRWGRDRERLEGERQDAAADRPFASLDRAIGMMAELAGPMASETDSGAIAVMGTEYMRLRGSVIAGLVETGYVGVAGNVVHRLPAEVTKLMGLVFAGSTGPANVQAAHVAELAGNAKIELTAYQETLRQAR